MLCWCWCFLQQQGIRVTTSNREVAEQSQVVWLAVKPHAISRVLADIAPVIRPNHHLVVSAAAGIPIKTIEKVRKGVRVNFGGHVTKKIKQD